MSKPLHHGIVEAQLPTSWNGLSIDRYDEVIDPDEHIDVNTTHISLYTMDDNVMCRVFLTSLKGGALN